MACKSKNSDADAKDVMSGPDAELSTLYENVRDMMSGPRCVVCGKPPGMSGGISWGGCRKHGLHIKCASKVEGLAQAISHWTRYNELRWSNSTMWRVAISVAGIGHVVRNVCW